MVILTVVLSFLLSGSFRHHISQHSALEIGVLVLITPLWYMACPDSFLIFRHGFFRLPRPGLNLKFVVIIVFYAALVTIMAVLRGAWFMTARLSNALSTSSSVSGVLKAEWHEFVRYLDPSVLPQYVLVLFVLPSFFGVAILIVTFSAVCLLLFCRRFDIGFEWFNRHFDVEKKPLQSIGLVAGALVAVVYWAAVIVSRVVG
jgi:hypothetical protein